MVRESSTGEVSFEFVLKRMISHTFMELGSREF